MRIFFIKEQLKNYLFKNEYLFISKNLIPIYIYISLINNLENKPTKHKYKINISIKR